MKSSEKLSAEKSIDCRIAAETERVVRDHVSTIFAVQGIISDDQPFPYTKLKAYQIVDAVTTAPERAEKHIREFFAKADLMIDQEAAALSLDPAVAGELKLMFRRLYTVVDIELQIKAMMKGRSLALKMVGGKEKNLLCFAISSRSGNLFRRSQQLLFRSDPFANAEADIKALLVTDDVSHSGDQMEGVIGVLKAAYPTIPIVVSLSAITTRAKTRLADRLSGGQDRLLFQAHRLCLSEMIKQVKSEAKRDKLTNLARAFINRQGKVFDEVMEATHIITPFKLPDELSNGELATIDEGGYPIYFTFCCVGYPNDRLYPKAI